MLNQYFKPPKQLEALVRHFWILDFERISTDHKDFRVFARRYPRMVFQHHEGMSAISRGGDTIPVAYAAGLNTKSYTCRIAPSIRTTGVSFYPHGLKVLFGIDCNHLVNDMPDLINFVPRELIDRMLDSVKINERLQILSDYLIKRAADVSARPITLHAWKLATAIKGDTVGKDLAEIFNVSPRHLYRHFHQTVGMSPKQYLQISRFEQSIDMLHKYGKGRLADLAYTLNYADQSHFIREFKSLSNFTPLEYMRVKKLHEENSAIMVE